MRGKLLMLMSVMMVYQSLHQAVRRMNARCMSSNKCINMHTSASINHHLYHNNKQWSTYGKQGHIRRMCMSKCMDHDEDSIMQVHRDEDGTDVIDNHRVDHDEFDILDNNNNTVDSDSKERSTITTTTTAATATEIPNRFKRMKFRQHVNPLARAYQMPFELKPNWMHEGFENVTTRDLVIDIGCAKGTWALQYATLIPNINILGLEIRRQVVEFCLHRKEKRQMKNVHFLTVNANVDLDNILSSLMRERVHIKAITIQFPDPHFKTKHKKRRVVNTEFVYGLAKYLQKDTMVFMQSDIEELLIDMVTHFSSSEYFVPSADYNIQQLSCNISPFPIQTEREVSTLSHNKPVYRMLFHRNDKICESDAG